MSGSSASPVRLPRLTRIIVVLGLLLGLLETLQQYAGNALRDVTVPFTQVAFGTFVPWLLLLPLLPPVVHLAGRWPMDQDRWRRNLGPHLAAMLVLVVTHQFLVTLAYQLIPPPPIASFGVLLTKLITFRFAVDALVYWGIVGVVHAARASRDAREREQAAARLEASLAEARLAVLREQLGPHFLFNSLNAVSTLALRGDAEAVTGALATLSDLLRLALESRSAQEQPLPEELAFLDRYLDLQRLRFGDRLVFRRHLDPEALDALVPVMFTQPLVENAIRHGIEGELGEGRIELRVERRGDDLRLEITDTGPGFSPRGDPREGIGLANTRARLAGLYGPAASLDCGAAPSGGGRVTIVLPYRPAAVPTPVPDPVGA